MSIRERFGNKTNSMLQLVQFPDGYGFTPPFDVDELTDQSAMFLSLFMSIALVFLIMGALFESFLLPIAIITTIPMAIFGAYWSLYLAGSGMDKYRRHRYGDTDRCCQ